MSGAKAKGLPVSSCLKVPCGVKGKIRAEKESGVGVAVGKAKCGG